MRPYAGRIAIVRPLALMVGLVDQRLGMLASLLGQYESAEAHFAGALALAERMRGLPWQADILHSWAEMLCQRDGPGDREQATALLDQAEAIARSLGMELLLGWIAKTRAQRSAATSEGRVAGATADALHTPAPRATSAHRRAAPRDGTFRRDGGVWTLIFEDRTTRVRDLLGMGHLARLLSRPEREVHVVDLVGAAYEGRRGAPAPADRDAGDAGEMLDARARAAYEARLRDANEELTQTRQLNDLGQAERLMEEVEFLTAELSRGYGLARRPRRAASGSERARVSVTRAIKYAIDKIAEHDPMLAEHLRAAVRTGTFCVYTPPARDRVSWTL
jgi:tetratricopeptide (TPR) repeat protein